MAPAELVDAVEEALVGWHDLERWREGREAHVRQVNSYNAFQRLMTASTCQKKHKDKHKEKDTDQLVQLVALLQEPPATGNRNTLTSAVRDDFLVGNASVVQAVARIVARQLQQLPPGEEPVWRSCSQRIPVAAAAGAAAAAQSGGRAAAGDGLPAGAAQLHAPRPVGSAGRVLREGIPHGHR